MIVKKDSYRGFDYEVEFTGDGDWRSNKNKFYATNGLFTFNFYKDYDSAVQEFKDSVDSFLKDIPEDVDSLVSRLSSLLVWSGYEDCEFDTKSAKVLIENFLKARGVK